jgi:hypothetical protein
MIPLTIITVLALFNLFFGRTMTVVLGSRRQVRAGFFRALMLLCRDYFFGYSNTQLVRDGAKVRVRQQEIEFRKNRPAKSVLIFEVKL